MVFSVYAVALAENLFTFKLRLKSILVKGAVLAWGKPGNNG